MHTGAHDEKGRETRGQPRARPPAERTELMDVMTTQVLKPAFGVCLQSFTIIMFVCLKLPPSLYSKRGRRRGQEEARWL